MLERAFQLGLHQTSVKKECLAGVTTFLAMAYILFVNPSILAQTGMDKGAIFTATCLAAAFSSLLMGLLANYPIALAPGIALSTYFTYGVVLGAHHSWQVALGAVFISGTVFLLLSILPLREYIINSIPKSMKMAIVAGIGLFLGVIGFKNAGILVMDKATLTVGSLMAPTTLLAMVGFFLIVVLDRLRIAGCIFMSILIITIVGTLLGYHSFHGVFSFPPSLLLTLFQMDIQGAFSLGLATIVFAFLCVDLFDNTGTLLAVAHQAGLLDKEGRLPRLGRALIADSAAALVSATLGTSTTTSYLESAVGVKMGGRTGLVAVTVALLFLLALWMAPLADAVPLYATAPAIVYVACLMTRAFADIHWKDPSDYAPALITAVAMPVTFSIAQGISIGFIAYVVIKVIWRRWRDLSPAMVVLAGLFIAQDIFLHI